MEAGARHFPFMLCAGLILLFAAVGGVSGVPVYSTPAALADACRANAVCAAAYGIQNDQIGDINLASFLDAQYAFAVNFTDRVAAICSDDDTAAATIVAADYATVPFRCGQDEEPFTDPSTNTKSCRCRQGQTCDEGPSDRDLIILSAVTSAAAIVIMACTLYVAINLGTRKWKAL